MTGLVKVWKEIVTIPTYEIGKPEKYPIFLEKRVYQGSSGAVYPHPVIEHISDEKIDKEWEVVFIENDYLKIMVLPALGGRVQMAYDKVRQRHFVYYNHVIKPALVGLTGPWISGGIEFNWPQHHRPSTYDPVDFRIEENSDGSKTIWVSELERMFRTKGMAGFTLYPDKAYLEIKVQLYNRTPHPQTFLWWANPAVKVNDHYQSVFPPDVNAVFDHGKRAVTEFPIAKGEYYKVDYAPGTDISRYKNIPVPTSYMAIQSEYDFVGGYENDSKGGLLHIADHNVSPGKKQWTWGNGDFGQAWDRNLTDDDGPYIELMCGVHTDNQPDFSWLHPYEEKSFKQYFMPYYNVGVVKNATKEALINLDVTKGIAHIKVHVTSSYKQSLIVLKANEKTYLNERQDLDPTSSFETSIAVDEKDISDLKLSVFDQNDVELVSWTKDNSNEKPTPEAAKAAKQPHEIDSTEQLFLRGLHLEQYRHATYNATDYYLEALKREPGDVRNNNAMGSWYLKRGRFELSLQYFDKAIETLTERNPNPYDGEPYFNRGLALRMLGRMEEAYSAFFKACWNSAWQDAGYFNLAQIDCSKGNYVKALELVDKSLIKNWHNHKARHLKTILLHKLGKTTDALKLIEESLAIDSFNFGLLYEKYLITQKQSHLEQFKTLIRGNVHNYIEYSFDYAQAGMFDAAAELLNDVTVDTASTYPMGYYFKAWYMEQLGDTKTASSLYKRAETMPPDYCFPNRIEEIIVLQAALKVNPSDAKANYYLGNYWYATRQYDQAKVCWEASVKQDRTFSISQRNLALLYYNKEGNKEIAKEVLENAFRLDQHDSRIFMELDQLYKKLNIPVKDRLILLEKHETLTNHRDDLSLEHITLLNALGRHEEALKLIQNRHFHPWEGGEGKVPIQYVSACIEIAKVQIELANFQQAIQYLKNAQVYPDNLGEGKLFGVQENDLFFWLGVAYDGLKDDKKASEYWNKAAVGLSDPSPAMFYNDQQPDKIFYQGLALLKLGRDHEAQMRFKKLIRFGEQHMNDAVRIDYFAVSLPDLLIWEEDIQLRNKMHCYYLIGLGSLGLHKPKEAIQSFDMALNYECCNLPVLIHKKLAIRSQK